MKQKPSFQFYTQDFLGSLDVQTMTAEQVGCYCIMLLNCYNNGGTIPNDPEELKVLCRGIAPAQKVLKKFYADAEFLRNERVDFELKKQKEFSKIQRENAKSGWDKRKNTTMPSHSHRTKSADNRQCSSSSSSSSKTPSKEGVSEARAFGNKEINGMLLALKQKIGIESFADASMERNFGKHCVTLISKIGKDEFVRRLEILLQDPFHHKNCNKIKYVYSQIKGFIEPNLQSNTARI